MFGQMVEMDFGESIYDCLELAKTFDGGRSESVIAFANDQICDEVKTGSFSRDAMKVSSDAYRA